MDRVQLQQEIALYYTKLPEEAKVFFAGMSWIQAIESIANEFSLDDSQKETIATETTLLLLGLVDLRGYVENIRSEIILEGDKTDRVIDAIGQNVLNDIASYTEEAFENNLAELQQLDSNKNEAFSGLNNEIKLPTGDPKQKLYQLGSKYNLPIDQIGEIDKITENFISGKTSSGDYELKIKEIITSPKRDEIINEINNEIIKPKRENVISTKETITIPKPNIPLPPYAKIDKEVVVPTIKNHSEYIEHGIEIIDQNKNEVKNTTNTGSSIIEDKLFKPTSSITTVNDYSIPKITPINKNDLGPTTVPPTKSHDPYREAI